MGIEELEDDNKFNIILFGQDNTTESKVFTFPTSLGFVLSCPVKYKKKLFFDKDKPNLLSNRIISKLLCEAIMGNVHMGHQINEYDSAEHFREIISYLEDLFVSNTEVNFQIIETKK